MKNQIKGIIKKMPGIRNLVQKNIELRNELEEARRAAVKVGQKAVDLRLKLKRINGEKINVVFVCHRPAVWESLHSVYDALKADDQFNVSIVAIPNKIELPKLWLNHEIYESEGAEEFWKEYGCINGYNYETKEWLDLRTLNPDYVFFQQPYNITRSEEYKSWNVGQYAKILFVPYGIQTVGGEVFESVHPSDFMNCLSFYFATDQYNYADLVDWFKKIENNNMTQIVVSGFPRYDQFVSKVDDKRTLWRYKEEKKKYRILWTPRWCTNEGTSTFFEYKDNVISLAKTRNDLEIVLRPHPQAFSEWNATGEMKTNEQILFRKECEEAGIIIDESSEYVTTLKSTDCFLTDITSLMGEYLVTQKPIIYCHKKEYFTEFGNEIAKSYYYARNWKEVEYTINMLAKGFDNKKQTRDDIIAKCVYFPKEGSGKYIAEVIKNDSLGDRLK